MEERSITTDKPTKTIVETRGVWSPERVLMRKWLYTYARILDVQKSGSVKTDKC